MPQKILTANRLTDGLVVYLGAGGWANSPHLARRAANDDEAKRLLAEGKEAVSRNEVADAWLIDVETDAPVRRKEAIRSKGPTVRPDLGYQSTPGD
jgi:hypothetical protein